VAEGLAFGMLLMNSPLAIVLYFLLPAIWMIVVATVSGIRGVTEWLNLNDELTKLSSGDVQGDDWAKLATSSLVWIALPLLAGVIRLLRRELK
jgi:ABC-2 type transport system permease protein